MANTVVSRLVDSDGNIYFDFNTTLVQMRNFSFEGQSETEEGDPSYQTVLTLLFKHGTSTLRQQARSGLRRILALAKVAIDERISADYIWWEHWESGETAKRALVFGGEIGHGNSNLINGVVTEGEAMLIDVAIERHAKPERISTNTVSGTISHKGGALTLPVVGQLEPRIAKLELRSSGGGISTVRIGAVGIRPFNRGVSAFDPVLDVDSTFSPSQIGNEYQYTIGKLSSLVSSADYSHYAGRYRVFAEFALTGWNYGTLELATHGSFNAAIYMIRGTPVDIESGQTWCDLGELAIPLAGDANDYGSAVFGNQEFTFFVTVYDGSSPTINITKLYLLPISSYLFSESFAYHDTVTQQIVTPPDGGDPYSVATTATQIRRVAALETTRWTYPLEGGALVVWSPESSASCVVTMTLHKRYEVYGHD